MPPSGFTPNHTRGISDYLWSCFKDLIQEGKAAGLLPTAALTREIRNIDNDLAKNRRSDAARATLQLIRAFYVELTKRSNVDYNELQRVARPTIDNIIREIESIKVEETVSA